MTISEFILARIAEEDAAAQNVPTWGDPGPSTGDPLITHIRLHFPDRELRRSTFERAAVAIGDDSLLRLLAAVWSDHHDYDPEWASPN